VRDHETSRHPRSSARSARARRSVTLASADTADSRSCLDAGAGAHGYSGPTLSERSASSSRDHHCHQSQYGITDCVVSGSTPDSPPTCGALYELDHLIPRSLGGADAVENLWPERLEGPCNAHHKDRLEVFAHKEFCAGRLTLDAARALFTGDWRLEYRKRFGAC
jgi:hypothetical protein